MRLPHTLLPPVPGSGGACFGADQLQQSLITGGPQEDSEPHGQGSPIPLPSGRNGPYIEAANLPFKATVTLFSVHLACLGSRLGGGG